MNEQYWKIVGAIETLDTLRQISAQATKEQLDEIIERSIQDFGLQLEGVDPYAPIIYKN